MMSDIIMEEEEVRHTEQLIVDDMFGVRQA